MILYNESDFNYVGFSPCLLLIKDIICLLIIKVIRSMIIMMFEERLFITINVYESEFKYNIKRKGCIKKGDMISKSIFIYNKG